ncbi:class III lanthionine synthetase LanKC [Kitasatospora cineracea]|uniref:class III lanthionine synthetase LanKC n=1 Tax=Kitasatospora cineracea TaxID=88074 RepID=UPI0037FB45AB
MLSWEALQHYVAVHPHWYETPARHVPTDEHLAAFRAVVGDGWRTSRRGTWFIADPPGGPRADQGWKLHVSALDGESTEILRLALPVLCAARVPFKFQIDPRSADRGTGKVYSRTASGKFITVYPADEEQFLAVGAELAAALAGRTGPYVLTDRRWPGSTAVYYRYGGFAAIKRLRPDGAADLQISRPDGTLVPDYRRPWYEVPDWVRDPFPPDPEEPGGPLGGRYLPQSALAFNNRGGVYLATDTRTGAEVVLKEARPGVTCGRPGIPCTELLAKEHRLLTRLADTGHYVRPLALIDEWEHAFLVEEKVEGVHFGLHCIVNNPMIKGDLRPEALRDYFLGLRPLWGQIASAVEAAHRRGILLGDLSFTNVIVHPDGLSVRIIDLEAAVEEGVDAHTGLRTVGLASPRMVATGRYDRAHDWHTVGAILLSSLMAVNNTVGFHRPALPRFLHALAEDLALPAELTALITDLMDDRADGPAPDGAEVVKRIEALPFEEGWTGPVPLALPATARHRLPEAVPGLGEAELADLLDGIARYAETTADPLRTDRLFPAHPMAFETNPLSVAYGAAGVLHGLHVLRGSVPPGLLSWLLARDANSEQLPPGLYLGQSGVAWVLDELGRPEAAAALMDRARAHPLRFATHGLLYGAAGYGLAALQLWRRQGDPRLLADAVAAAEALSASALRDEHGLRWPEPDPAGGAGPQEPPRSRLGYAHGGCGPALFLLYLHLATGDRRWRELGREALDFELAQRVSTGSGRWAFRRTAQPGRDGADEPVVRTYWDEGTAGVATVALRWLVACPDPALAGLVPELVASAAAKYAVMPQLFHGLAGIGHLLLDAGELLGDERWFAEARRTAAGVLLSRIDRPEGVVFPGEQALRETVDLASGSIGVGLFLDRLRRAAPHGRTNNVFTIDGLLP